jgi:hypothetical protein
LKRFIRAGLKELVQREKQFLVPLWQRQYS